MHTPWQSPLPELQGVVQTLRLARGQAMQVWLQAGSQIICNAAAARITEAPQWLRDQLVSRRHDLADGEVLMLEQGGWVEILAPQGGELLCMRPVRRRWQRTLSAMIGLWPRRRIAVARR